MGVSRFYSVQDMYYDVAYNEIKEGVKKSHWMWFIFPQMKCLGFSSTSEYYGIEALDEAIVYLKDEKLGNNLVNICNILLTHNKPIEDIFGYPDYLKLKSSMTLFMLASEKMENKANFSCFKDILDKFYNGEVCNRTIVLIKMEK